MNTNKNQRTLRRGLVAAALVVAVAGAGASFADSGLHHPRHADPMAMEPAAMDAHIDKMVAQLAGEATPDQQAKVAAIAKRVMADLRPLHEQRRQTYARAHALLMAPVVDRAALEQLRTAHVQQFDAGSRRILEAVADAADVLTPEQRLRFAGHLRQLMH
jgi:Spy/CpxP family protein refolding chaperone